jgi:uncharacterized membrane protein YeaQ/YmgE (transglycosylase-associated protein family)
LGEWNLRLRTVLICPYSHRDFFLGGNDGPNLNLDYSGSSFWWRRFLSGSALPLLWRWPRHDTGNRHHRPSTQGLTHPAVDSARVSSLSDYSGEFAMYMSGEGLLTILVVGLIAGWLAGQIVQGTGFGIVGDLLIGIVGAFIGSWLLPQIGLHLGSGIVSAIINATVGALLLLLVVRLVRGGGGWRRSWGGSWRRRW